jgi:ATP-dependent Clp protease protease subunit
MKRKLGDDNERNNKKQKNDHDHDEHYDEHDKLLYCENNHIYFRKDVDIASVSKLSEFIRQINKQYSGEDISIILHISSFGGDLLAGFLAYDLIKMSKLPINTLVEGYAVSAGSLMSVAGSKRFMTTNSYILIHQLSSWNAGNYEQIKDDVKNCDEFMERIKKIYVDNTKIKKKDVCGILKHDIYWNSDVCLKHGLVDEIM